MSRVLRRLTALAASKDVLPGADIESGDQCKIALAGSPRYQAQKKRPNGPLFLCLVVGTRMRSFVRLERRESAARESAQAT